MAVLSSIGAGTRSGGKSTVDYGSDMNPPPADMSPEHTLAPYPVYDPQWTPDMGRNNPTKVGYKPMAPHPGMSYTDPGYNGGPYSFVSPYGTPYYLDSLSGNYINANSGYPRAQSVDPYADPYGLSGGGGYGYASAPSYMSSANAGIGAFGSGGWVYAAQRRLK